MNKNLIQKNMKNYRFQLWPSEELIKLIQESVAVSHDPIIAAMEVGWFARLVRAALTCYIAYCKTVGYQIAKGGPS